MVYNIRDDQKVIELFQDYKQYSAGFRSCKELCKTSELVFKLTKQKGATCQGVAKFCKKCECHWKAEVGVRCPCCNQRLKARIRSKQSREVREQQRIINEYNESVDGKYFWYSCDGCGFDTPSHIQSFFHKRETGHQRTIKEISVSFIINLIHRLDKTKTLQEKENI